MASSHRSDLVSTKNGPATPVRARQLLGLPGCSLGALERARAPPHSRGPPGAGGGGGGQREAVEEPAVLTLGVGMESTGCLERVPGGWKWTQSLRFPRSTGMPSRAGWEGEWWRSSGLQRQQPQGAGHHFCCAPRIPRSRDPRGSPSGGGA